MINQHVLGPMRYPGVVETSNERREISAAFLELQWTFSRY